MNTLLPPAVRVLLIDRCEDVAVRVLSELQHGGFRTVWERVTGPGALTRALEEKLWDIVVCGSAGADEMNDVALLCRSIRPRVFFVGVTDAALAARTAQHEAWLSGVDLGALAALVKMRTAEATCRD